MRLTYNGTTLSAVLLGLDGDKSDPYKAVLTVKIDPDLPPLEEIARMVFIEENYILLLALCKENHLTCLAENAPAVVH